MLIEGGDCVGDEEHSKKVGIVERAVTNIAMRFIAELRDDPDVLSAVLGGLISSYMTLCWQSGMGVGTAQDGMTKAARELPMMWQQAELRVSHTQGNA